MKRRIVAVVVALSLVGLGLRPALADPVEPFIGPTDPPNCLGQDRADFAQNGVLGVIDAGSGVALDLIKPYAVGTGFGTEVQYHRTGSAPNNPLVDLISTCND